MKGNEPWLLLTNLPDEITRTMVLHRYAERFEIEEAFKDVKWLQRLKWQRVSKPGVIRSLLLFTFLGWWLLWRYVAPTAAKETSRAKLHPKRQLSWFRQAWERIAAATAYAAATACCSTGEEKKVSVGQHHHIDVSYNCNMRISDPNLANVIGYEMQASGYPEIALTAKRDGADMAANYLWGKAYEYGLEKTTFWLVSLVTDRLPSATLPFHARPELQAMADSARTEEPPSAQWGAALSTLPLRKAAGLFASMPSESLSRRRVAERLGIPPETVHSMVARLLAHQLIQEDKLSSGDDTLRARTGRLAPTQKLHERVDANSELTLWKRFFQLGEQLGLKNERHILAYLVSFGELIIGNQNAQKSV